ncbi:MAG: PEP-CTERM sorting domain-containing protein [Microcoleaceae cyanobacterium]
MKFLSSKTITTALLATGVIASGMAAPAFARGQSGTTCNVLDVTGAIDCYGSVDGNDKEADVVNLFKNQTEITNDIGGVYNWNLVDKSDDGTDVFFSTANGSDTGTITFLQDIDYTFAINLKAANFWSAYFFDGAKAGETVTYTTAGVAQNKNGKAAGLSHASMFISDNAISSNNSSDPQEVPEPTVIGGLLMLGLGLATSRRRKA